MLGNAHARFWSSGGGSDVPADCNTYICGQRSFSVRLEVICRKILGANCRSVPSRPIWVPGNFFPKTSVLGKDCRPLERLPEVALHI